MTISEDYHRAQAGGQLPADKVSHKTIAIVVAVILAVGAVIGFALTHKPDPYAEDKAAIMAKCGVTDKKLIYHQETTYYDNHDVRPKADAEIYFVTDPGGGTYHTAQVLNAPWADNNGNRLEMGDINCNGRW